MVVSSTWLIRWSTTPASVHARPPYFIGKIILKDTHTAGHGNVFGVPVGTAYSTLYVEPLEE